MRTVSLHASHAQEPINFMRDESRHILLVKCQLLYRQAEKIHTANSMLYSLALMLSQFEYWTEEHWVHVSITTSQQEEKTIVTFLFLLLGALLGFLGNEIRWEAFLMSFGVPWRSLMSTSTISPSAFSAWKVAANSIACQPTCYVSNPFPLSPP